MVLIFSATAVYLVVEGTGTHKEEKELHLKSWARDDLPPYVEITVDDGDPIVVPLGRETDIKDLANRNEWKWVSVHHRLGHIQGHPKDGVNKFAELVYNRLDNGEFITIRTIGHLDDLDRQDKANPLKIFASKLGGVQGAYVVTLKTNVGAPKVGFFDGELTVQQIGETLKADTVYLNSRGRSEPEEKLLPGGLRADEPISTIASNVNPRVELSHTPAN